VIADIPDGGLLAAEWLMLGAGMLTQMANGAWHLAGILLLKRVVPSAKHYPYWGVLLTFWGLLLLPFQRDCVRRLGLQPRALSPGRGSHRRGVWQQRRRPAVFLGHHLRDAGLHAAGSDGRDPAVRHAPVAGRLHAHHLVGNLRLLDLGRAIPPILERRKEGSRRVIARRGQAGSCAALSCASKP